MNIVGWARDHLDYRCAVFPCLLNIDGETETVYVSLKARGDDDIGRIRKVLITREDKSVLQVYLDDLAPLTECLYYFTQENGVGATLLIPLPEEQDDGN